MKYFKSLDIHHFVKVRSVRSAKSLDIHLFRRPGAPKADFVEGQERQKLIHSPFFEVMSPKSLYIHYFLKPWAPKADTFIKNIGKSLNRMIHSSNFIPPAPRHRHPKAPPGRAQKLIHSSKIKEKNRYRSIHSSNFLLFRDFGSLLGTCSVIYVFWPM